LRIAARIPFNFKRLGYRSAHEYVFAKQLQHTKLTFIEHNGSCGPKGSLHPVLTGQYYASINMPKLYDKPDLFSSNVLAGF